MKLYHYEALKYGAVDFFVLAEGENKARRFVKQCIDTTPDLQGDKSRGWPFKYELAGATGEGQVIGILKGKF